MAELSIEPTTDTPVGFRGGDRHGWLAEMCEHFSAMLAGRHAKAWLEGGFGPLPRWGAIATMPVWHWVDPGNAVGRKARSADGGRLLLPIRLKWTPGPLIVLGTGEQTTLDWMAIGVGHSGAGKTNVTVGPASQTKVSPPSGTNPPSQVHLSSMPASRLRSELELIVDRGQEATWHAIARLEPYVETACRTAAGALAKEIGGDDAVTPLIDEVTFESIRDKMLFGDGDRDSSVDRLLELCLRPTSFRKVDPMLYIRTRLRQEASQHVQQVIGDPRIGPKVRRVFRQHGGDLPEFLERYNELYPADHLAVNRASNALTAGPVATARPLSMTVDDDGEVTRKIVEPVEEDHSDEAVEVVEIFSRIAETSSDPQRKKRLHSARASVIRKAQRTIDRATERTSPANLAVAARIVRYGPTLDDISAEYRRKWPDDPLSHLFGTFGEQSMQLMGGVE